MLKMQYKKQRSKVNMAVTIRILNKTRWYKDGNVYLQFSTYTKVNNKKNHENYALVSQNYKCFVIFFHIRYNIITKSFENQNALVKQTKR